MASKFLRGVAMLDLIHILGKAYMARVLHRGDEAEIQKEFSAAMEHPEFATAARHRLAQLEALDGATGNRIAERDYEGGIHLDFLRKALQS